MKVFAQFYGGSSYAAPDVDDVEEFQSLAAASDALRERIAGQDSYFPAVSDDAQFTIFFYDPRGEFDAYPDRIIRRGPRGGMITERA